MGDLPSGSLTLSRPRLVGREAELELLRERLEAARAGRGSLVLLAGEPGIGKTRLAEELAGEARRSEVAVLWGRCWEGEGAPPFWPWRQLLRAYGEQQPPLTLRGELGMGAIELARLVPEIAEWLGERPGEAADGGAAASRGAETHTLLQPESPQSSVLAGGGPLSPLRAGHPLPPQCRPGPAAAPPAG